MHCQSNCASLPPTPISPPALPQSDGKGLELEAFHQRKRPGSPNPCPACGGEKRALPAFPFLCPCPAWRAGKSSLLQLHCLAILLRGARWIITQLPVHPLISWASASDQQAVANWSGGCSSGSLQSKHILRWLSLSVKQGKFVC